MVSNRRLSNLSSAYSPPPAESGPVPPLASREFPATVLSITRSPGVVFFPRNWMPPPSASDDATNACEVTLLFEIVDDRTVNGSNPSARIPPPPTEVAPPFDVASTLLPSTVDETTRNGSRAPKLSPPPPPVALPLPAWVVIELPSRRTLV